MKNPPQKNPRIAFVTDHQTEANLAQITELGDITMSRLTAAIVEREAADIPLFIGWLNQQEPDSDNYRAGIKAIRNLDRRSLIESIRDIDWKFMTPAEAAAAQLEEAQTMLALIDANPDMGATMLSQTMIAERFKLQCKRIKQRENEANARVALDSERATAYLAQLEAKDAAK